MISGFAVDIISIDYRFLIILYIFIYQIVKYTQNKEEERADGVGSGACSRDVSHRVSQDYFASFRVGVWVDHSRKGVERGLCVARTGLLDNILSKDL